jgi:hypothetical protein
MHIDLDRFFAGSSRIKSSDRRVLAVRVHLHDATAVHGKPGRVDREPATLGDDRGLVEELGRVDEREVSPRGIREVQRCRRRRLHRPA